jgi:hypothetical protein
MAGHGTHHRRAEEQAGQEGMDHIAVTCIRANRLFAARRASFEGQTQEESYKRYELHYRSAEIRNKQAIIDEIRCLLLHSFSFLDELI